MVAYLVRRARRGGRPMAVETAELVCALAGPVPNDVQRLAQCAFEVAGERLDDDAVAEGMTLAVARQAATFAERYERLAGSAQRLLRLMAEGPIARPYAGAVLRAIEVANDNAARKALAGLEASELAVRRDGAWDVADPFWRQWLLGTAD